MAESAVRTEVSVPASGNILSGGVIVNNSNTPTTFLTIPAGRAWNGTVSVSAANGVTTQTDGNTSVVTAGTGVIPAAGTVLAVGLSKRDTGSGQNTIPDVWVFAPASNSVTLQVVNNIAATTYTGAATASGILY